MCNILYAIKMYIFKKNYSWKKTDDDFSTPIDLIPLLQKMLRISELD